MTSRVTGFFLAASLALAATSSMADDTSANLRLMAFGSDAQLTAVKHAVERFNQKFPNVKVELAIDPISNGWGDYVTHVLSQFNGGDAYDVYGTAIETFRTFETRGLFLPLDDFIAKNPELLGFRSVAVQILVLSGKDLFHPDRLEQHHDQLQPRAVQGGRESTIPRIGHGSSSAKSPRS